MQLLFYCSFSTVCRGLGQSATGKFGYNSGSLIHDLRIGLTYDFRFKPVMRSEMVFEGATITPAFDRAEFWNMVEERERNWRSWVAREVQVGLPHLLTPEQNYRLLWRYAIFLSMELNTPVDIALHPPSQHGDQRNIHGHLLFPTRVFNGQELTTKHRFLDLKFRSGPFITRYRAKFADLTNEALREAGYPGYFVSHLSYSEQGITKMPGQHLGPKRAAYLRKIEADLLALGEEEASLVREKKRKRVLKHHELDQATTELHCWLAFQRGETLAPKPTAFSLTPSGRLYLTKEFIKRIEATNAALKQEKKADEQKMLLRLLHDFLQLARAGQKAWDERNERDKDMGLDVA